MNSKLIDRLVAAFVFVYALVLYLLTVAPTASFWDSGEFIAIAHGLQVSHPPGAPFYMLVGRLFSMFVPAGYVALAVNLVSVLASAFTVLLAHLIIVRLVRQWQGDSATWTLADRITALAGGVIGACTFAVTDSFWFNAVEAEVYALSMFFTAAVVWLIMKWSEQARREEAMLAGGLHPFGLTANRYLILIAYLFGLAIGVHLLNLLAVFFVALIVFFTEFERPEWTAAKRWKGILLTGVVSSLAFLAIYPGVVQWLPELAGNTGTPIPLLLGLIALVVFAIYYTHRRRMQLANLIVLCLTVVLIGYSTYALIFIRSAADPPIDENDPETTEAIVSYLKREQYGQTPLLKGAAFNDRTGQIDRQQEKLFPRRHSPAPEHLRLYSQYASDLDFFLKYQLGHMYLRYFLWNFAGRASDVQDAPAITGLIPGETEHILYQSPSERASRNAYYGLPLLLGLFGALFHFSRDSRRAFSVLVLFLVTGLGIILYLNQTPLQPRERDYSYVGSFFAFSLWVGLGAAGLLQLALEGLRGRARLSEGARQGVVLGLGVLLLAAVPLWMLGQNYDDHDRSGNYVAPEYAYNMLMSLEEHAILFTNGDNDTFPLWYLQEVEGVRRDVRVVNLSLLNTAWYVKQLKNQQARQSAPLPISLTEDLIDRLGVAAWEPRTVSLPVDKASFLASLEVPVASQDLDKIESPMTWLLEGRPYSSEINVLYAADQVAFDILQTNAVQGWDRPVYFAVTVSRDGQLDLQNYFQLEGQAFRVVPIRHEEALGRVVPSIILENLRRFKFTNLDDPNVYYDENIRRMVDNYRNIFAHSAETLAGQGLQEEAVALLDTFLVQVPFETIPGDERSHLFVARAYQAAGARDRAVRVLQQAEPVVLHRLTRARSAREADLAARYAQMMLFFYMESGDYDTAAAFNERLADAVGDSTMYRNPEELRREFNTFQGSAGDEAAAEPPQAPDGPGENTAATQ